MIKTHPTQPIPIVVAASGTGRSLENLIRCQEQHSYRVCGVITSHLHCGGAVVAQTFDLPLFVGDFPTKASQAVAGPGAGPALLQDFLRKIAPQLVVLAGFIRPYPLDLSPGIPALNIHPSLLPKYGGQGFYGERVHRAVLHHKETITGASCHFVSDEYDQGELLCQVVVAVKKDDTVKTLAKRVFAQEKQLLPVAVDFALARYGGNGAVAEHSRQAAGTRRSKQAVVK